MKCISVQEFLYLTHFPPTWSIFRFCISEEECHISQQMVSDLKNAVIASDGKMYDAWMLQTWLWSQFNRETSEFFVIPSMPIQFVYISEPSDIILQFFEMQNLRYIAKSLYSSPLIAYFFCFAKFIVYLSLSLIPKLTFMFRFFHRLILSLFLYQHKRLILYLTKNTKRDIGIQCDITSTYEKVQTAPFSLRINQHFQIPSKNSDFHRVNLLKK